MSFHNRSFLPVPEVGIRLDGTRDVEIEDTGSRNRNAMARSSTRSLTHQAASLTIDESSRARLGTHARVSSSWMTTNPDPSQAFSGKARASPSLDVPEPPTRSRHRTRLPSSIGQRASSSLFTSPGPQAEDFDEGFIPEEYLDRSDDEQVETCLASDEYDRERFRIRKYVAASLPYYDRNGVVLYFPIEWCFPEIDFSKNGLRRTQVVEIRLDPSPVDAKENAGMSELS